VEESADQGLPAGLGRLPGAVGKPGITDVTLAELRQFLGAKGVAKQYWPERELISELPRTASGKIRKFELREQVGTQS
jgi:cyclohexanecarboxylate-CoA ligase